MENLYYIAPSNDIFTEVKFKAMLIWLTYDDTYGYASEKIGTVNKLKNIGDNLMYIVAMFDHNNQHKLAAKLSPEALNAINDRLIAGGGSGL